MRENGLTDGQDAWVREYIATGVRDGVLDRSHDDILRYAGGCDAAYQRDGRGVPPEELVTASHAYMYLAMLDRDEARGATA